MSDEIIEKIALNACRALDIDPYAQFGATGVVLIGGPPPNIVYVMNAIRSTLFKAGYRIEHDPGALLARGEENVAGGKVR